MGCNSSNAVPRIADTNAVKFEYLASELIGEIVEDDYLALAMAALESFQPEQPIPSDCNPRNVINFSQAYLLQSQENFPLENGYVRASDGSWYIACKVDLGEITGEMFDWWFRACENTERFRWWHPKNHKSAEWDLQLFATPLCDRSAGSYVNHINTTHIIVDGQDKLITLDFDRPSKYFDVKKFSSDNITACVCSRIHLSDSLVGWIGIGHLVYIVRKLPGGGNVLQCRYWLGDVNKVDDNSLCHPGFVNAFGNSKVFRLTRISQKLARAFWLHCHEQMACLKAFLPNFYMKSHLAGNVFETKTMLHSVDMNDVGVTFQEETFVL